MHPDIFKSDPIYFGPAGPNFNKVRDQKTLRNFGVTEPDHEMVLTAVDRPVRGKPPLKLRVENQWGDTIGTNGDMHMYRQWFPYVTDATVPREALPKEILKLFEQPPHPLPGD
jgi:aminopeptidase C